MKTCTTSSWRFWTACSFPLLFLLMKIICLVRERGKKPAVIHPFLFRYDCSLNMLSEVALSSNHYQRNIWARMEQKMLQSWKSHEVWRIVLQPAIRLQEPFQISTELHLPLFQTWLAEVVKHGFSLFIYVWKQFIYFSEEHDFCSALCRASNPKK